MRPWGMRSFLLMPLVLLTACAQRPFLETGECLASFGAGANIATCSVPGWEGRDYDLVLPEAYEPDSKVPVVIAFHGGGGNRAGAAKTTCSTGKVSDRNCLHAHAQANGYAVVFPDGTSSKPEKIRTWNAGGGVDNWRCTSGDACTQDVDDMAYLDALLEDLEGRVRVDQDRIHATGLSNGGAISHRFACERADRVASIVAIGGAMQLTTSHECAPSEPVAVMQVHGTADPAWRYEGGVPDTVITGQADKEHVSVERTMDEWAEILECSDEDPEVMNLADPETDGTSTTRHAWQGCQADLVHLEVTGGGHAWPDGWQYFNEKTIGPVVRDWGNELIWEFLKDHPKSDLTPD